MCVGIKPSLRQQIVSFIAESFNLSEETISPEHSFAEDLDADELDILFLIKTLEKDLGIQTALLESGTSGITVGDLIDAFEAAA